MPIQQCTLQLSVLQVGELFRTSAFNLHARKNGPPRSLDTLTLKELFAMKAGIENRSLSAKMLAQLYEPQEGVHVQVCGCDLMSAPRTACGCGWRLSARNSSSGFTASCPCVQSTALLNTPLLTQSLKSSVVSRNAQLASIHNQRMRRKREAAEAAAAAVAAAAGPAMTQQQMNGVRSKGGTGALFCFEMCCWQPLPA